MKLLRGLTVLIVVIFSWLCAVAAFAEPLLPFSPEVIKEDILIHEESLGLTAEEKTTIAGMMVDYVTNRLHDKGDVTSANALPVVKALALALALDPKHKQAVVYNFQFEQGIHPEVKGEPPVVEKHSFLLMIAVDNLLANDNPDDNRLGAFLLDVVAEMDPRFEDAVYKLAMLKQEEKMPLWPELESEADTTNEATDAVVSAELSEPVRENRPLLDLPRKQASLKGLAVVVPNGFEIGTMLDIIVTGQVLDNGKDTVATFSQSKEEIGSYTERVLNEVMRLLSVRYPDMGAGGAFSFSFGDKFTPKDGPSYGAAFAVLLISMLEDFDLDESFTVTGDITVDGKLRSVGGVVSKLKVARDNKFSIVMIPHSNESSAEDLLILDNPRALIDLQIFSAENIDQVLPLAHKEKFATTQKAIDLFNQLKLKVGKTRIREDLRRPENLKILSEVLQMAPNHLSAKYLTSYVQGFQRKQLFYKESINELLAALGPVSQYAWKGFPKSRWGKPMIPDYEDTQILDAILDNLSDLNFKLDAKAGQLQRAMYDFISSWKKYIEVKGTSTSRQSLVLQDLYAAQKKIENELAKISQNKEMLEQTIPKNDN
ncbi:MAG: S16 family serine protease [Verrucomicrobiota bacterium]